MLKVNEAGIKLFMAINSRIEQLEKKIEKRLPTREGDSLKQEVLLYAGWLDELIDQEGIQEEQRVRLRTIIMDEKFKYYKDNPKEVLRQAIEMLKVVIGSLSIKYLQETEKVRCTEKYLICKLTLYYEMTYIKTKGSKERLETLRDTVGSISLVLEKPEIITEVESLLQGVEEAPAEADSKVEQAYEYLLSEVRDLIKQ